MALDERTKFQIATEELQRRWKLTRDVMTERGVDVLVVQGANAITGIGGTFYWLTGTPPAGAYPQTLIFPREGDATVVRHGPFGDSKTFDPSAEATLGLSRYFGTPTFPAVHYTLGYDAEIVVRELQASGYRSIATAGMATAYGGFHARFHQLLSNATVDLSDAIDDLKAQKSAYEIQMLEGAAALQDRLIDAARSFIRPGVRDQDVMAELRRIAEMHGCEGGVFLGSSFSFAEGGIPVRYPSQQGRQIREGDLFFLLVENAGLGGMYVHASRYFSLGKPPQQMVDTAGQVLEAQAFTASLLSEDVGAADVFHAYNDYMAARGFPKEARLHAHGQGYDLVERPLIRHDEPMRIRRGLNIGIHPAIFVDKNAVTISDNFILEAGGLRRLHQSPQTIIQLS